jgi:hypothetical protein
MFSLQYLQFRYEDATKISVLGKNYVAEKQMCFTNHEDTSAAGICFSFHDKFLLIQTSDWLRPIVAHCRRITFIENLPRLRQRFETQ